MVTYWTEDDFHAGRCSFEEIATLRPAEPLPAIELEPLPPELENVPAAILRRDALAAYKALGGVTYLMSEQPILNKLLLKLLPQEVHAETKADVRITIDWAGPDRLSYQRQPQPLTQGDIVDVPSTPSSQLQWKETRDEADLRAFKERQDPSSR